MSSVTGVLIKRGNLDTTHTGGTPCEDKGVMLLQAKERHRSTTTPEAGRGAWNRPTLTASEGTALPNTLIADFWPPELSHIHLCGVCPLCSISSWQPQETQRRVQVELPSGDPGINLRPRCWPVATCALTCSESSPTKAPVPPGPQQRNAEVFLDGNECHQMEPSYSVGLASLSPSSDPRAPQHQRTHGLRWP